MTNTASSRLSIKTMSLIGVVTALICILAPLSIPIGIVPISLTNLMIYFGIYVLGTKKATISYFIYLLIGLVGIPVFSGFTAGPAKLFGPTGGYLIGFIPMTIIAGLCIEKSKRRFIPSVIAMIIGTGLCYLIGTTWLAFVAHMNFRAALFAGVIPFIPGDLIKIIIAAILGPQIYQTLSKAHLL